MHWPGCRRYYGFRLPKFLFQQQVGCIDQGLEDTMAVGKQNFTYFNSNKGRIDLGVKDTMGLDFTSKAERTHCPGAGTNFTYFNSKKGCIDPGVEDIMA